VAAVVFTQGCNYRCPFCHNSGLLATEVEAGRLLAPEAILAKLRARRGKLDAVVVTGGEPTLQADLAQFLEDVRTLGFLVKLDTNGSRPDVLAALFEARLLDYVAMDVKATWSRYKELAGVDVCVEDLQRSLKMIAGSGVPHEFRTTIVPALVKHEDIAAIREQCPGTSFFRTQQFRPERAVAAGLRRPAKA
jgi:pyruvate formate lyase activating enzyme